jgi:cysteine sulfinate desulfinase/cysteine desulfurase-like protein
MAARRVLADARLRVARFLGCGVSELVFTSGATEANHTAVLGALSAQADRSMSSTQSESVVPATPARRQWALSAE